MTQAHPGFKNVANAIAKKGNLSFEKASAILASHTRSATPTAKKTNPRLNKVKV